MKPNKLSIRFKEEIERVGVSKISKGIGKVRNTIYNWAENGNIPSDYLTPLNDVGVDIIYVLFGIRQASKFDNGLKLKDIKKLEEESDTYDYSDIHHELGHQSPSNELELGQSRSVVENLLMIDESHQIKELSDSGKIWLDEVKKLSTKDAYSVFSGVFGKVNAGFITESLKHKDGTNSLKIKNNNAEPQRKKTRSGE